MNKVALSDKPKRTKARLGGFYQETNYGDVYLLCFTGDGHCLISISSGNRWFSPTTLEDIQRMLDCDFAEVTSTFMVTPDVK